MADWEHAHLGASSVPEQLSDLEIAFFFTLTADELAAVRGRRTPVSRLALDPEPETTMTDDRMALLELVEKAADALREKQPKLGALMDASRDDVLAYIDFPREHWPQIASANPLERVNREIKRRADVIGVRRDVCPPDRNLALLTPQRRRHRRSRDGAHHRRADARDQRRVGRRPALHEP
jgi:hypothetical protein